MPTQRRCRLRQHAKWRTGKWESPVRGRGRNRSPNFSLSADFTAKGSLGP